jgi:phenylpropionate dioxygenase-like ring-hydroxylating dioxygenase large terminal subunit
MIMQFPLNTWYMAAWAHEVGDAPLARTICNEQIVLFRDRATGLAAALQDRCCHRGAPLRLGEVTDRGLRCGYHGVTYDCSGSCVHVPGPGKIPSKLKVRNFAVEERDEVVWIWMGEPAQADHSKILAYPYHGDTRKWPHKKHMHKVAANYMLLIENLMDLTHLAFVHKSTIGGNPQAHADAKMTVVPKDTGLHFIRWLPNSAPPATYSKALGITANVDRWMEFEYFAPGNVVQWTGALETGRGAEENRDQPGGFSLRILHSLTPETEHSSLYFWSISNGYRQEDPDATEQIFQEVNTAFQEDKAMVEAQQSTLLSTGGEEGLVNIVSDVARVHMRRALQRLIDGGNLT